MTAVDTLREAPSRAQAVDPVTGHSVAFGRQQSFNVCESEAKGW